MIAGVADTHAALWYLFGDVILSALAKAHFDAAASARRKVTVCRTASSRRPLFILMCRSSAVTVVSARRNSRLSGKRNARR